jgi:hypothetical protein
MKGGNVTYHPLSMRRASSSAGVRVLKFGGEFKTLHTFPLEEDEDVYSEPSWEPPEGRGWAGGGLPAPRCIAINSFTDTSSE